MKIIISRHTITQLYTEGVLIINDKPITRTVECTVSMLPVGQYELRLIKKKSNVDSIQIYHQGRRTKYSIDLGHSWISSRRHRIVCIGKRLIPGVIYRGRDDYQRLKNRIHKCKERHQKVSLTISEQLGSNERPSAFWSYYVRDISP